MSNTPRESNEAKNLWKDRIRALLILRLPKNCEVSGPTTIFFSDDLAVSVALLVSAPPARRGMAVIEGESDPDTSQLIAGVALGAVSEVWVVDPIESRVLILNRNDAPRLYASGEIIRRRLFPDAEISVDEIFSTTEPHAG